MKRLHKMKARYMVGLLSFNELDNWIQKELMYTGSDWYTASLLEMRHDIQQIELV